MDKIYLVKAKTCYADEFDISAHCIMTQSEYIQMLQDTTCVFVDNDFVELSFGSNEYVVFENFKQWKDCISFNEITKEESEAITKFFRKSNGLATKLFEISNYC